MEVNMDTKPCPFCGESILVAAIKCKHCGEFVSDRAQKKAKTQEALGVVHAALVLGAVVAVIWWLMDPCKGAEQPRPKAPEQTPARTYSLSGTNCLIELPSGPLKAPGWEGMIPIAARPGIVPKTMSDLGAVIKQHETVTTHETQGFSTRVTVNKDGREGWVPMEWLRCP